MISYFQAMVIGLLQGVTELFPISSLGHSVLIPAWLGWDKIVGAESADESFYLAFVVALHVATATALFVYFRNDWFRIIRGSSTRCALVTLNRPTNAWHGFSSLPPSRRA